jgi:hypothetical protein
MGSCDIFKTDKFYINLDDEIILTPKKIKELKMVVTHKLLLGEPIPNPSSSFYDTIPIPAICAKFVPSYDITKLNDKYFYINYFQSKKFINFKPIYCKIDENKITSKDYYENINKNN